MRCQAWLALSIALTTLQPLTAQIPSQAMKLRPADDAAKDPSFFTFRAQLIQALSRRDTTYLYSIMAEDMKNPFGTADGIPAFKQFWGLEQNDSTPGESPLWEVFTKVLSLGGRLRGDVFQAPYISAFWPEAVDPYEFVAIVGEKVGVRASPDNTSMRIDELSFDIVGFKEWKGLDAKSLPAADAWANVELGDGRTGWIHHRFAYSPTGWRAFFVKRSGRWVLTMLVAGD